ncbi:hypothetical protein M5X02_29355 [Paenibacillus alvei]|uniref:hypothetical protein n=1 Tax=Paenibacillus alvei TaxID=44250 RepID=UPI00028A12AC|nr:hypothetical protein [Paenibacillus alvei]EJW14875.1 hypothetical protein PAV_11c02160 [Paenibacillus alvei DSM 29]MCY9544740.1 hypothetical protein [Paenibacillus alvei]MCY9708394.1 hypothetical protein [Paenibacillus alvei]MEC0083278.1 hypothetical protein [Paenibacillus alvei]
MAVIAWVLFVLAIADVIMNIKIMLLAEETPKRIASFVGVAINVMSISFFYIFLFG